MDPTWFPMSITQGALSKSWSQKFATNLHPVPYTTIWHVLTVNVTQFAVYSLKLVGLLALTSKTGRIFRPGSLRFGTNID